MRVDLFHLKDEPLHDAHFCSDKTSGTNFMRIRIIRYHDHVGGRENRPNLGVKTWSGFFENALAKANSPFSIRDIEASNNVVNSLNSLKESVENAFRSGDFPIIISFCISQVRH